jgi:hypothetical protein
MTWRVRPFPEATIPAPEEARFWTPSRSWVHRVDYNVRTKPSGKPFAMHLKSFSRFWDVIDWFYCFAMHVKCDDANFPNTVIKQWWDSDGTVMQQWCLWFELFNIVFRCHWSYFILLQCIWSMIMHLLVKQDLFTKIVIKQWWDSDETLMQQSSNSDAFELGSFMSFSRFWDVIDHILFFCNAFEVWLCICWDHSTKTVNKPLIWANLCHFQGCEMSSISFYPFAMRWKCYYASAGDTRPFDKNSEQTVMRQWWNSDATVMSLNWALLGHFQAYEMSLIIFYPFAMPWKCCYWSGGETRPTANDNHETLMRHWWDSDGTVMEQWCF